MNVNLLTMAGRVTRETELTYTPNQVAVCSFGIAVNKKYKDKETVCFADLKAFGKTAENIHKYFNKGNRIFVTGELAFDSWTAQDGTKRSKHYMLVNNFQFIDSASQGNPRSVEMTEQPAQAPTASNSGIDEDLPF